MRIMDWCCKRVFLQRESLFMGFMSRKQVITSILAVGRLCMAMHCFHTVFTDKANIIQL